MNAIAKISWTNRLNGINMMDEISRINRIVKINWTNGFKIRIWIHMISRTSMTNRIISIKKTDQLDKCDPLERDALAVALGLAKSGPGSKLRFFWCGSWLQKISNSQLVHGQCIQHYHGHIMVLIFFWALMVFKPHFRTFAQAPIH